MIKIKYYFFLTASLIAYSKIRGMEENHNPLNDLIKNFQLTQFTFKECIVLKKISQTIPQEISTCKTEADVLDFVNNGYNTAYNRLKEFIIKKNFVLVSNDTAYPMADIIEKEEKYYKDKEYNKLPYNEPIENIKKQTVTWHKQLFSNTILIPFPNTIISTTAKTLGVSKNCFLPFQTPGLNDCIIKVKDMQYFILGITPTTRTMLNESPQNCFHFLLHELTHLKKGDGPINVLFSHLNYTFNGGRLRHIGYDPELENLKKSLAPWREYRADIESILHPNDSDNTTFSQKARAQIYLSALKFSLKHYDHITCADELLNKLPEIELFRLQMFIHLLKCNETPLDFEGDLFTKQFTLLGYKIFKYF